MRQIRYNTNEPIVRSRWERTLISCPVCNSPIGERCGNQWWFMKYGDGEKGKIPFVINQNAPQGDYKVSCWRKDCNGGHIFTWIHEAISINDNVITSIEDVVVMLPS